MHTILGIPTELKELPDYFLGVLKDLLSFYEIGFFFFFLNPVSALF